MVDDNRYRTDPGFLADPAVANGQRFGGASAAHGVEVVGPVVVGSATPKSDVVASVSSAPVRDLMVTMLQESDNETAESLLRELGGGATANGIARIDAALATWCLDLAGAAGDGSGMSRETSARRGSMRCTCCRPRPSSRGVALFGTRFPSPVAPARWPGG